MKIILADNQDITRIGVEHIIREYFEEEEYGEITNVLSHLKLVQTLKENDDAVVIIDSVLFDLGSIDELLMLHSRFEHTRWLIFTDALSEGVVRRLAAEPRFSILLKSSGLPEIQAAIKYTINGSRFFDHQITDLFIKPVASTDREEKLTPTEIDILKLVAAGKSAKEIAIERFSSIHTITTHKKNIFRKLGVNTVHEATMYAIKAGIADVIEYYI